MVKQMVKQNDNTQSPQERVIIPILENGIPETNCREVFQCLGRVRVIDVRNPDEFTGELGHIQSAELVTLGAELTEFLKNGNRNQEIVFVCRSGGRSGRATAESIALGYRNTVNMQGGMLHWNEQGLPVERNS